VFNKGCGFCTDLTHYRQPCPPPCGCRWKLSGPPDRCDQLRMQTNGKAHTVSKMKRKQTQSVRESSHSKPRQHWELNKSWLCTTSEGGLGTSNISHLHN